MNQLVTNRDRVIDSVRENDWSGGELERRMGVSRTEATRFLNGNRVEGKKTIAGLIKAFLNEPVEQLFIFLRVEPKRS